MQSIGDIINEVINKQIEDREKRLTEIIEKYDFLVGSSEIEKQLMKAFPEADVICTPYVENQKVVYLVKKFDITDELKEEQDYGTTSFSAW